MADMTRGRIVVKKPQFTTWLTHANKVGMQGLDEWVFHSGMLFGSPDKWWGDLGRRDFPHEGLDFAMYRDTSGRIRYLDRHTRIPAMFTGTIKSVFSDYLGQAIVMEHADRDPDGTCRLSIYAHTVPLPGIRPGKMVNAGDIIASIADTSRSKAAIRPHLHYTLGRVAGDQIGEGFEWNDMRDPNRVDLNDPLEFIDWPYRVTDRL
jgi:murein DD-endopeptidase MepM/ murein hydrolase activator NlpD